MRSFRRPLALLGSFGVLAGCALSGCASPRSPELPDPNVDLGLGNVVMMTWTTRAHEGLLGHVLEPIDAISVDPLRQVIVGTPRAVGNDQTLRIVISTGQTASVAGGYGPVSGSANGARATHIAYDVRITGYLEYPPEELEYSAASGCCAGGAVTDACGMAYVSRLIRGTGTAQHLQELRGSASISATEVIKASGGAEFRKLSESSFQDTYFAYELAPLEGICARLEPEQEIVALSVEAPKNCYLTRIDAEGDRATFSWTLPSKELCAKVAERRCQVGDTMALSCEARYGTESEPLELPLPEPREPSASAPGDGVGTSVAPPPTPLAPRR